MSLLDPIVVCDAVLETVMQQEVFLANRTDSAAGRGTALDPFNAGGSSGLSDPPFDQIMRALSASLTPITVRLLPGTYYTRGFPTSGSQGWRPFSGLRLVGSGMENTKLVRSGTPSSGHNAVIGNSYTSTAEFIDALEISDLTVEATHVQTSGVALSGIAVAGRNILIERVRVKNMGNNTGTSVPAFGISVARAHSSAPYMPENCVVNEATVESPAANATGTLFGIHLSSETEGMFHQFCVVRNCLVNLNDGPSYTKGYTGIAAGGGLGVIVEHNRVLDCKYGIGLPNLYSTRDLIVRHNYIRLPQCGIYLNMTGASGGATVARVIMTNNIIEWPSLSEYNADVIGICSEGSAGVFVKVAVRDNMIRRWNDDVRSGDIGIPVRSWNEAVVDNNVVHVSNAAKGVQHPNPSLRFTSFNNLTPDGTLLCACNTDTNVLDQELETEVQDLDMMLFKK